MTISAKLVYELGMKMHHTVDNLIETALEACDPHSIEPDDHDRLFTQTKYHGVRTVISARAGYDRQYNDIMKIAKKFGLNPKEHAEKVAAFLREYSMFETVEVGGNGFINIKLSNKAVLNYAHAWWPIRSETPRKIVIDFGGPNIAKALHVGHLRSLVIGESLRRILMYRGHDIVSDIHLGDWGLPMGMLIGELINRDPSLAVPSLYSSYEQIVDDLENRISCFNLEEIYPEVVAACKADPEKMEEAQYITSDLQHIMENKPNDDVLVLGGNTKPIWEAICNMSLKKILLGINRLGATFDLMNGESSVSGLMTEVFEVIEEYTRVDDGATVIDVALPTDKKPYPPLIFKKSNDGYTYAATDLVTIWNRVYYSSGNILGSTPDQIIYVVDNRQALHFEQLFRACRVVAPQHYIDLVHAGFGTVNGKDGKPFKTRDGGVPTLDWMLDTVVAKAKERTDDPKDAEIIGIGAIKYADLITHRESGYVFDIDRIMALEGKTGPYIQYACVRIQHILNKVDTSPNRVLGVVEITCDAERELLLTCANFPEIIEISERLLTPHHIAEYAFTLAQKFSTFYAECPVIDGDKTNLSRVEICLTVQGTLKNCLFLLGIDVPSKM
jgi:arginyl-tRNA synthetase